MIRDAFAQPAGAAATVDRALLLYRTHLRAFGQVVFVVVGVLALYRAVGALNSGGASPWATASPLRAGQLVAALGLYGLGLSLPELATIYLSDVGIYLLTVATISGALIHTAARAYLGGYADVALGGRSGGRRIFAVALPALLAAPIAMLGAQLGAALPALLWLTAAPIADRDQPALPALSLALALLRTWAPSLLLCLGLLALSARLLLAAPAVELEGLGPLAGLRRSWLLSRGGFWRIFLAALLCATISGVLIAAPRLLGDGVMLGSADLARGGLGAELGQVGAELAEALTFPILVIVPTLLYYGQRVGREGYDIELRLLAGSRAAAQELLATVRAQNRLSDPQTLAALDEVLRLAPAQSGARFLRSWVRYETGDLPGALADIDPVAAASPGDPHMLCLRGAIRLALGDGAGAAIDLGRVLMVRPGFVRELEQLASANYDAGNLPVSRTYLERILLLQPGHAWAYYNRACIFARLGDHAAALASLSQAIRIEQRWRADAANDTDLAALRDDQRFRELLAAPEMPV